MEEVREAAKEAFGEKAKSATMPFVQDADTGEYIFKTKSRYQPKAWTATGKVIPTGQLPQIFGGSEMSLAGTLFPYQAGGRHGISMQLGAVQLVKLSESSNTATASSSRQSRAALLPLPQTTTLHPPKKRRAATISKRRSHAIARGYRSSLRRADGTANRRRWA